MINKVLYTIDQRTAVTTAQQKCARDNIGAQVAGDYVYTSAISAESSTWNTVTGKEPLITYNYSGTTITGLNGSAVGSTGAGFSGVYHDGNLSGSGVSGEPLGLSSRVVLTASGQTPSAWYSYSGTDHVSGLYSASIRPSAFTMKNTASDCKTYMQDGRIGIKLYTDGGDTEWECVTDVESTRHSVYESVTNVSHNAKHDWVGYSALRYDGGGEDDKFQSSELTYGMLHMNSGYYTGGASSVNKLLINPTSISAGYDIPGSGKTNFLLCTTALNLPDCTNFEIMPGVITWGGVGDPGYMHYQNANGMFFADLSNAAGNNLRISPTGTTVTTTSATASYGTALYKMLSSLSAWATAQGWTP